MPFSVNLPHGSDVLIWRGAFAPHGPATGLPLAQEMGLIWAGPVGPEPC